MPKIEYSCKRKKDFVTFSAIAMFIAICIFELFLIFVLPVRLKQQDAMAYQVKKQYMLSHVEVLRRKIRLAKPKVTVQECEVQLVADCLDAISRYVRMNVHNLTVPQLDELVSTLLHLHTIADGWQYGQYQVREQDFDHTPILKTLEEKLDRAAAAGR